MSDSILIIEDDATLRLTLGGFLERSGYEVALADDGATGLALLRERDFHLALLDLRLPDTDGLDVLRRLREFDDETVVVVMTAYPEVRTAVAALKAGAWDYINKPFDLDDLAELVRRAIETGRLRRELAWRRSREAPTSIEGLIGESPAFVELIAVTSKMAAAGSVPVLIRGESGTGKERVAQAIHAHSDRSGGPWVTLNCSALPEGLLESELFGHERGAFTDAKQAKRGLLEMADGGTLFLDEIGDLSLALQPKLLRVLQTQSFRRVGGSHEIRVDTRFVAATHRDLESMMRNGLFREDLFYRLNVGLIEVPPLRERPGDIDMLARHFLEQIATSLGRAAPRLPEDVLARLRGYPWPGNIRELRNVIERAAILSDETGISAHLLPSEISGAQSGSPGDSADNFEPLTLAEAQRRHVRRMLEYTGGNKTRAAELLGISRATLRTKID